MQTRREIFEALAAWQEAWDSHDLDGVMELFHEDVLFENWTGARVRGRENLRRAWAPWFMDHGDFRFTREDTFVDEAQQKALTRLSSVCSTLPAMSWLMQTRAHPRSRP